MSTLEPILLCPCGTEYRTAAMYVGEQDLCPKCRAERAARMQRQQQSSIDLAALLEHRGPEIANPEVARKELEQHGIAVGGYPAGLPRNVLTAELQEARRVALERLVHKAAK